ncbi:hypothetical protein DOY81_000744 [Sarcophaga bullata]|nr:hypothetical protein DOY81_000744 [Sarcophaga bullata]
MEAGIHICEACVPKSLQKSASDTKGPRPNVSVTVLQMFMSSQYHECVGLNQYSSEYRTVSNSRGKRSKHICEACVPKSLQKSASDTKDPRPNASVTVLQIFMPSQYHECVWYSISTAQNVAQ